MPIWEQRNRLGEGKNRMVLPHKNHSTTFSSFFLLLTVTSRTAPAEGLFHYLLYDTTCTAPECSCPFLNSAHAGFPGEGGHRAGAHSPPLHPTASGLCSERWQNWQDKGLHLAKCRCLSYEHLPLPYELLERARGIASTQFIWILNRSGA